MNPILTVIILTYNHKDTIAKALESVLDQETSYPYQIWICEDCSTDETLRICEEYAEKHSNRIKLIAQPINTKGKHLRDALCKMDTKYFTLLEGDDYWCDKEKIQIAIDILEKNPEFVTFAHDTLYNNFSDNTKKSLAHEIHKIEIINPVNFHVAPYLHTSARIHRNVINFNKYPDNLTIYDIYLFYLFLDKGPMYYYDKVMSVYNITGNGLWSGLKGRKQIKNSDISFYRINKLLNYKYDLFFSGKMIKTKTLKILKKIFGLRFGWKLYIVMIKYNFFNY